MTWLARWRKQRSCFHHDHLSRTSWIDSRLVELGRAKHFWCTHCGRYWT